MSTPATVGEVDRRVLLVAHSARPDIADLALECCRALTGHGIRVRLVATDLAELPALAAELEAAVEVEVTSSLTDAGRDCELALVLGGDGTILRAAELTRDSATPLLGVNLGRVGFLAEAEPEETAMTIEAIVERRYTAEDRLSLDVAVFHDKELVARTFALNEASIEKATRQRMIDLVVEIDGRPLSRWGCDGVVLATPTGSTAYNFSAGGPIVWPTVEALLIVPLSAHALFARPMVVAPDSVLAVEVLEGAGDACVLWCDGRRTVDLPPGARVEVRRGVAPVRLVRLDPAPFTDRLVAKFALPVQGWRGAGQRRRERESPDA